MLSAIEELADARPDEAKEHAAAYKHAVYFSKMEF